ncbi:DegT/DnrJ/EryC1/StrS family aminotransferase [Akkermansiaceae bacterium]|nr:DegT/DnrJ/EryC1/StrS family aminotransferase [Akkermansiaceae bacterium]
MAEGKNNETIPVFKPLIGPEELGAARESLEQGWLGMGASVGAFEDGLAEFLELRDRHVVAVNTGYSALHLAFLLADVGPGDEVITPSFNNIADFQAILATGAKPVFCDILDETLCIDVAKAAELVTPRTKAIVAMDYDCCLADHGAVSALAAKHGIRVVHDAAHSFGSHLNGKKVGSFSDLCMFSFDPVKTITTIDGGALVVRTEEEVAKMHEMRLIGMSQPAKVMYGNQRAWTYDVSRIGYRYHMANLHAAIGLSQLKKMPEISRSRQDACKLYNELLAGVEQVRTPLSDFAEVTPFLYYIRVAAEHRQPLRDHLKAEGIDTGIHWQPGHWFSLLAEERRGDLGVTDKAGHEILSLPLHSLMPDSVVERVCASISGYFAGNR